MPLLKHKTQTQTKTLHENEFCHFFLQVGVAIPIFTGAANAMPIHPHRETMAYNAIGGISYLLGTAMP